MSETTTTENPVDPTTEETNIPESETVEKGNPNAEAAKYRRALRDVEGQRDGLAATVERLQRAEVTRLASGHLAQSSDLFDIGGAALADLLTEDGSADPDKVTAAVTALLQARPGLGVPAPRVFPDLGQGQRGGTTSSSTWSSVISGR